MATLFDIEDQTTLTQGVELFDYSHGSRHWLEESPGGGRAKLKNALDVIAASGAHPDDSDLPLAYANAGYFGDHAFGDAIYRRSRFTAPRRPCFDMCRETTFEAGFHTILETVGQPYTHSDYPGLTLYRLGEATLLSIRVQHTQILARTRLTKHPVPTLEFALDNKPIEQIRRSLNSHTVKINRLDRLPNTLRLLDWHIEMIDKPAGEPDYWVDYEFVWAPETFEAQGIYRVTVPADDVSPTLKPPLPTGSYVAMVAVSSTLSPNWVPVNYNGGIPTHDGGTDSGSVGRLVI